MVKRALIVIDMQKDFVDGSLANADAQTIAPLIADYIDGFDGDVIATRDTHAENYLSTAEGKKLPVPHCIKGTDGWDIVDEIASALQRKNARLVDKPTFGFLDWQILSPYDEVTLVGTCTDICVVSNALILKATYPDITVRVKASLCAGTNKQNHEAALQVMRCCQVDVVE